MSTKIYLCFLTLFTCTDRLVTALHMASDRGHGGIVELLVKHGAKVYRCTCII